MLGKIEKSSMKVSSQQLDVVWGVLHTSICTPKILGTIIDTHINDFVLFFVYVRSHIRKITY